MGFKPNNVASGDDKEYEMCYVDFDTVLFRAAKSLQEDYIIVKNKQGRTLEFKGVTQFYGKARSKDGGWIADQNTIRAERGLPLVTADDYEIIPSAKVKPSPEPNMSILEWGLSQIDFKVGAIKRTSLAKDYRLGIGSLVPTYRYDAAHIIPYKGERKAKPLLFNELRDAFITKYKSKVMIARDGLEMDDEISIKGWESYAHFLKTGKHKYVLAFVDKDLKSSPAPYFNYDKVEDGVYVPTPLECCTHYCSQLLSGDKSVDNIQGLPNISKEFAAKYDLAKPRGMGKATALELVSKFDTPKDMYAVVCEAYQSYYGTEPFEFISHRGEVSQRNWLDMLAENAKLLYMCRTYEDAEKYDIRNTLKKLGVIE